MKKEKYLVRPGTSGRNSILFLHDPKDVGPKHGANQSPMQQVPIYCKSDYNYVLFLSHDGQND